MDIKQIIQRMTLGNTAASFVGADAEGDTRIMQILTGGKHNFYRDNLLPLVRVAATDDQQELMIESDVARIAYVLIDLFTEERYASRGSHALRPLVQNPDPERLCSELEAFFKKHIASVIAEVEQDGKKRIGLKPGIARQVHSDQLSDEERAQHNAERVQHLLHNLRADAGKQEPGKNDYYAWLIGLAEKKGIDKADAPAVVESALLHFAQCASDRTYNAIILKDAYDTYHDIVRHCAYRWVVEDAAMQATHPDLKENNSFSPDLRNLIRFVDENTDDLQRGSQELKLLMDKMQLSGNIEMSTHVHRLTEKLAKQIHSYFMGDKAEATEAENVLLERTAERIIQRLVQRHCATKGVVYNWGRVGDFPHDPDMVLHNLEWGIQRAVKEEISRVQQSRGAANAR